jgi:Asp-tRNA(Asn)/Glu-tRNA(Gln) amidotransferase A subunit family amidase
LSIGSAAAATALCPLALGTQNIGSVVGVKSSYARVPANGVIPVSSSVNTVDYFMQDLAGTRLVARC